MARSAGTLGSLLQGVSQQPDRVRRPGQVSEQINLLSDVTKGLTTRPGTTEGPQLPFGKDTHKYTDLRYGSGDLILGYREGDLRVWGVDGVAIPVTPRGGASLSYVGPNMRFQVIGGDVVMLNRETTVQIDPTVTPAAWNSSVLAVVSGLFFKRYSITVQIGDSYERTVSYTAPDGTSEGDDVLASSEYILENLIDQLSVDTPVLPSGTVVLKDGNTGCITHPTLSVRITTSDGEVGGPILATNYLVRTLADLPRTAPNGKIVKVTTTAANVDNYFLKFRVDGEEVEDGSAGFGEDGVWVEWYNPDETRLYDLDTMPHRLVFEGGVGYFEHCPWIGRPTGDSESSPFMSLVGGPIRDICGFEGRTVLLSKTGWCASRTGHAFDLWRASATIIVDTDPIDITSTKKDDLRLDWLVPFDRDLVIVADPGNSQFIIRGGGVRPGTISMVLTTEFEVSSGGTAPVSTGRTILLPFSIGRFSGVKEFFTDSDAAANAANGLTDAIDKYIVGRITGMAVSQNFNIALFRTDSDRRTVYVFKSLWDNNEVLQSAWSKWQFTEQVEHMFFRDNLVYFLSRNENNDVFLHFLDMNRLDSDVGYHITLDRKIRSVVSESGVMDLPYPGARFVQGPGCAQPGMEVVPLSMSRVGSIVYRYTLPLGVTPAGASVVSGRSVQWELTPTQVFHQNYRGETDTSKAVTVQEYILDLQTSGQFDATMNSIYLSEPFTWQTDRFPMDNEPADPTRVGLLNGEISVPWGERADWSSLTLGGQDIRPVTILEVRWVGQVLSKKGGK